jgi:hypothetical protein
MLLKASILAALLPGVFSQGCQSFGVDITEDASVFVNIQSNDSFSFVEQFQNCSNTNAQNYLVDPDGDEIECSDTDMDPANTPETSTW